MKNFVGSLISKAKATVVAAVTVLVAVANTAAHAAFAAADVTAAGISELLGSDTTDAETGIYEVASIVETGLVVILGIVIAVAGFMLVVRFVRRVSSAG